jgi:hypothetical protein
MSALFAILATHNNAMILAKHDINVRALIAVTVLVVDNLDALTVWVDLNFRKVQVRQEHVSESNRSCGKKAGSQGAAKQLSRIDYMVSLCFHASYSLL